MARGHMAALCATKLKKVPLELRYSELRHSQRRHSQKRKWLAFKFLAPLGHSAALVPLFCFLYHLSLVGKERGGGVGGDGGKSAGAAGWGAPAGVVGEEAEEEPLWGREDARGPALGRNGGERR